MGNYGCLPIAHLVKIIVLTVRFYKCHLQKSTIEWLCEGWLVISTFHFGTALLGAVLNHATNFSMLSLYPATLLNLLISTNSFCVESWGFSISCHLHRVTILPFLFQFGYLLFLLFVWFLWLIFPILCWIKVVRVGILVFSRF